MMQPKLDSVLSNLGVIKRTLGSLHHELTMQADDTPQVVRMIKTIDEACAVARRDIEAMRWDI